MDVFDKKCQLMGWMIKVSLVLFWVLVGFGIKGCMAGDDVVIKTIAYEASGESLEGQISVAKVILNRAKERCLTLDEVCLQPHQFSCWKEGKPTQKRILTKNELVMADTALKIAKNRLRMSSNDRDKVNLYMRKELHPKWLREGISKGLVKEVYTEGNHAFYYEARN